MWKFTWKIGTAIAAGAVMIGGIMEVTTASAAKETVAVEGTGVHYFTTSILHSEEPTDVGVIRRSTDYVELRGDVEGYVLYHVTSEIDSAAATMVNTGVQAFSGTILGSDPVYLFDDEFRFDVDLATGETLGTVRLRPSKDAKDKDHSCDLTVVGAGLTPEGNASVTYTGTCQISR